METVFKSMTGNIIKSHYIMNTFISQFNMWDDNEKCHHSLLCLFRRHLLASLGVLLIYSWLRLDA